MTGSMTGYGRSQKSLNGKTILVEIKSVNHRYFEFTAKTPRGLSFLDEKLKALAASKVSRGKVDLYLAVTFDEDADTKVKVNAPLAKSYIEASEELSEKLGIKNDITINSLLRIPDIFTAEKAEIDEQALWEDVKQVANEALDAFTQMRMAEGERLAKDLNLKLDSIYELVDKVDELSPLTVKDYRERLYKKLSEILQDKTIDEGRILQEAALFAEKAAVDEETVRLRSHIQQFRSILKENVPVGRKLDFLTQEINRESNTIGSKAQDVKIAQVVVELKSQIEKIREQIQNLE